MIGAVKKGERVKHDRLGEGTVTEPKARNGWIIVDFDNGPWDAKCAAVFLNKA